MKTAPSIAILLLGGALWASAAAPVKPPPARYSRLVSNSPFTVKPVETTPTRVEENPFEDWALGGISEVNHGHYLVLLNKKKQGEKIIVEPGIASDYKVLEVRRDPLDPKKTEVVLEKEGLKGTVAYDEKVLAAAPKAPQAQQQRQPGQHGQPGAVPAPGQVPGMPPGINPPRMRVLPPAAGQPGAQPAAQPAAVPTTQSGPPRFQGFPGRGGDRGSDHGDRGSRGR